MNNFLINSAIASMAHRERIKYQQYPNSNVLKPRSELAYEDLSEPPSFPNAIVGPGLDAVSLLQKRLEWGGGLSQQDRMIYDKRRSLDRALYYSYQGANIKKLARAEDEGKRDFQTRALINPNQVKEDYDEKILSIPNEYGFKPGDIFEWLGTKTYWLVYLQDLTELAYFRSDIRRCRYEIAWEDEDGIHSTYSAVRGPVETKIDYIQKHSVSVDKPNYSLNILMPLNEETLKYFRRYSKFYLQDPSQGAPQLCWRVEATDWISMPGVLEINATEYYINKDEDDVEAGIAGGLIVKELVSPNEKEIDNAIVGEVFIKPQVPYIYEAKTVTTGTWSLDTKKYPVIYKINPDNSKQIQLMWESGYSGQFELNYSNLTKTIVVQSLF